MESTFNHLQEHKLNISLARVAVKKVRSAKVGKAGGKSKAIKKRASPKNVAATDAPAAKSPQRVAVKKVKKAKSAKKSGGKKKATKGKKGGRKVKK